MAKVIRKNESLLTIKFEDNARLILNIQCINVAHYHCAMFALQQSLRGIKGDTSSIMTGVQYGKAAKSQMHQDKGIFRSTNGSNA